MPQKIAFGLQDDPIKKKDFAYHKVKKFLKSKKEIPLGGVPITHLGVWEEVQEKGIFVPPVAQGDLNACVPCSVVEAMQYLYFKNTGKIIRLDWLDLYNRSPKYAGGTKPSEVLEIARKEGVRELGTTIIHKLDAWSRIIEPNQDKIFEAIQNGGSVILGVDTLKAELLGDGFNHEIFHLDFFPDRIKIGIVNHWNAVRQMFQEMPADIPFINCIVLHDKPDIPKDQVRLGVNGLFANYFSKLLKTLFL